MMLPRARLNSQRDNGKVQLQTCDVCVCVCLTSPLALIRVVWNRSPLPHEFWVFHTRSEGGLWVPPAPEAQIYRGKRYRTVL